MPSYPSLALAFVALGAVGACKGGDSKSSGATTAEKPVPPSAICGAAATTLAALEDPDATPDDRAPQVKQLTDECHAKGFTDAQAQCLADAVDPIAALKCPRILGERLGEVDKEIGTGKCRPVMLTMFLAENAQLRQVPPEHRMEAIETFKIVKKVLAHSCRTDDWGADAMDCFTNSEAMRAFGCIEKVPREVLDRLDAKLKVAMANRGKGAGDDGPPIEATGVAACDDYLRAKKRFEACEAAPDAAKASLLAAVAPLEKPWRSLQAPALSATGETFAGLCGQASEQLASLAGSVGCN
jgi:hypothetical protein